MKSIFEIEKILKYILKREKKKDTQDVVIKVKRDENGNIINKNTK